MAEIEYSGGLKSNLKFWSSNNLDQGFQQRSIAMFQKRQPKRQNNLPFFHWCMQAGYFYLCVPFKPETDQAGVHLLSENWAQKVCKR